MTEHYSFYNGKRLLVTGATGFIGGHLVTRLLELGAQVRVVVHQRGWSGPFDGVEVITGDFKTNDIPFWEDACIGCDAIFHLAAAGVTDPSEPGDLLQQHVVGPSALLQAAAAVGVKAMVHTSSCFVYGAHQKPVTRTSPANPVSPYAASKVAAETWLAALGRTLDMPVACARLFHVYGPGEHSQRLIPYVLGQCHAGKPLELTSGHQIRDFLYVADAVDGLLQLGQTCEQHHGAVLNLGTGIPTSVRELVTLAASLFQSPGQPQFGAKPDRPDSLPFLVANADETEAALGLRPRTSLRDGLIETLRITHPSARLSAEVVP